MLADPQSIALAELFNFLEDVLVWIKDAKGCYRWVNRAFLLSFAAEHPGRRGELAEVVGKTDYDLSPPFLADQFRLDDEQALAGRRIVQRIELVGHADEPSTWNVTHKLPLKDATGAVTGTVGMTRPVPLGELPAGGGFGPVLAFLKDHYAETITNRQLAQLAHMSLRAFERKFLAAFHLAPQKYLRRLRLKMASRGLVFSSRPIVEIALSCGFADQSHFTREFRRLFGRTPGDYRAYYGSPGS